MAKDTVGKVIIMPNPDKRQHAWKIKLASDLTEHWLPYSTITAYNPATNEITVKKWILKQKAIKY